MFKRIIYCLVILNHNDYLQASGVRLLRGFTTSGEWIIPAKLAAFFVEGPTGAVNSECVSIRGRSSIGIRGNRSSRSGEQGRRRTSSWTQTKIRGTSSRISRRNRIRLISGWVSEDEACKSLKSMAGTTGLEPATSAVTDGKSSVGARRI